MAYSEKVMDHFNHPRNVGEMENPSAVFLWSQYIAINALQIKKIGEMTSDDAKRRYLMGGSRYVPDNFGSGWSKTGDRSK